MAPPEIHDFATTPVKSATIGDGPTDLATGGAVEPSLSSNHISALYARVTGRCPAIELLNEDQRGSAVFIERIHIDATDQQ